MLIIMPRISRNDILRINKNMIPSTSHVSCSCDLCKRYSILLITYPHPIHFPGSRYRVAFHNAFFFHFWCIISAMSLVTCPQSAWKTLLHQTPFDKRMMPLKFVPYFLSFSLASWLSNETYLPFNIRGKECDVEEYKLTKKGIYLHTGR